MDPPMSQQHRETLNSWSFERESPGGKVLFFKKKKQKTLDHFSFGLSG
jgi:hypothetical protein